jgi:DNA-binding transcriptional LysR family regulator
MITELRTLVAIARYGTFSAAAERIGLTQAAVSGHVRRLEEHLGFTLFDRRGRSVRLNPDGVRTLDRAKALLEQFEALGARVERTAHVVIRVGAITSVQSALLARALTRFHSQFPNHRVQVVPGLSLHLLDQVDAGELDLAVITRPPYGLPPDLDWQTMSSERYVLVVPQSRPGDDWREVLRSEPFLRYDRLAFGGRQVDRFIRALPFPVNEVMEVPVQTMINMVGQGLGVALIPRAEAHFPLPSGVRALELTGADLCREVGIVSQRRKFGEASAAGLIGCLLDQENETFSIDK